MAEHLYYAALAVVALVIVAVIGRDVMFWLAEIPTVTDFLRANPAWFHWPAGIMLVFILGLWIHLYGKGL